MKQWEPEQKGSSKSCWDELGRVPLTLGSLPGLPASPGLPCKPTKHLFTCHLATLLESMFKMSMTKTNWQNQYISIIEYKIY